MKKINIIGSLILLFIMGITSSCTKKFLDRTPSDRLSSETFFTQKKDLIYAVNGCYAAIGFCDWGTNWGYSTTLLRIENVTDNSVDEHSWNELYDMALGTGSAYDPFVSYYWKSRWKGIQRCNRVIENAHKVKNIDPDLKARLVSEAHFLRDYFYFDMVYLWGDVPYLTKSITPEEAIGIPRTNKDIVMDSLVKDLTDAAAHLPLKYPDSDLGRATKGAALALKARILLYQKKWKEAAAAAKAVMDLKEYHLYPDYKKLFSYAGIDNEEVIFDLQEMPDKQWNFTLQNFGPNSVGGWSSGTPTQSLVDAYECIDGKTIDQSPLYDPTHPYQNRDPRLAATILYPGHPWLNGVYNTIPGASYPGKQIVPGDDLHDGTGGQWNKTFTGYNWLKYMDDGTDYYNGNMWNGSIHLILIRYAEVLLTYAEAKIEANEIDQSVADAINAVRERASMPDIQLGNQDDMRKIVRRERRVEFAFEGLRLMDIRRWHIAQDVMNGIPKMLRYKDGHPDPNGTPIYKLDKRYFDPNKDYLWPIPQSEIDVSKIAQNPGW
jgi:hypothetical protein